MRIFVCMTRQRVKIILLLLFSMLASLQGQAQREVMYAHYMFNTQEINPAYAGSRKSLAITSLNRSHWSMVFERAPMTHSFNLHSPWDREDLGVGLSFRNETHGPVATTSLFTDVSYSVKLDDYSTLSFGLKSGVSFFNVGLTELIIDDPTDPHFGTNVESHWLPNFGFGLYYRKDDLFVGMSIPKFLEVNYFDNSFTAGVRTILSRRNVYFIAGKMFRVNPDIIFVPTTYIRLQKDADLEADITATLTFYNKFSVGAMVRLQDALGVLVGMRITEHWTVGYSFDWSVLNRVPSFNFGSHEIILRYDLFFMRTHREDAPRYF